MLESIKNLLAMVPTIVAERNDQEVQQILAEGQGEWMKEKYKLGATQLSEKDMLDAKITGDILGKPKTLLENIQQAMSDFEQVESIKATDEIRYAKLTGQQLKTVVRHKAELGRGGKFLIQKALIDGAYVSTPLITEMQNKRNDLFRKIEEANAQLARVKVVINGLTEEHRAKLVEAYEAAQMDVVELEDELDTTNAIITSLFEETKLLEMEHGYSYDSTGKKVFNKGSEYHQFYGDVLKRGRTGITEIQKYSNIKNLDFALVAKAKHVFKVA